MKQKASQFIGDTFVALFTRRLAKTIYVNLFRLASGFGESAVHSTALIGWENDRSRLFDLAGV